MMSNLYMKCTTDKLELPLIVEESPTALANRLGLKPHSVATLCSKQKCGYHRVKIDEWWPTNDGGLWRWDDNGGVIVIE